MNSATDTADFDFTRKGRLLIIGSTLLALFLGALDTLVMGAAMPTIVADLGGLHLYSWVFSAYLLSRAVALPVFGKLSDLFANRALFTVSILIFLAGSVFAGLSQSMAQLTLSRVVQGIGAGGTFALTYIVLADILVSSGLPDTVSELIRRNFENVFRPEIQALLPTDVLKTLQGSIGQNILLVFQAALIASLACFLFSLLLPGRRKSS